MPTSLRALIHKLRELSAAEWRDLLSAQTALLMAQYLVWRRPTGALISVAPSSGIAGERPAPAAGAPPNERVRELALAVERAAENGLFRPLCLVRALALQRLLRARGCGEGQVHVGVRRNGQRFMAHAWVEFQGHVLGDRAENVSKYAQLAEVSVVQRT